MTDEQFDQLLQDCFDRFGEEYFTVSEESVKKHRFSMRFYWNMRRIRGAKTPAKTLPQKRRLALALSVMILLAGLAMTACGFWSKLIGFVTYVFEDHTQVEITQSSSAPQMIETYYTLTELPEGYELVSIEDTPQMRNITYTNERHMTITFLQQVKKNFIFDVNTEDYRIIPVMIANFPGYVVFISNKYYLMWERDEYTFSISADGISEIEILISIAESVQMG